MRRKLRVLLLISVGLLQACAPGPTPAEIAANYNASQRGYAQQRAQRLETIRTQLHARIKATSLPANYQRLIDTHFVTMLKDPESRRVDYGRNPYGSLVCGTVNAKNSYGGYTGAQPFHAFFNPEGTLAELEIYPPRELQAARALKRENHPLSDALLREAVILEDCNLL
jgi:hypothetical protein